VSLDVISEVESRLSADENPRDVKMTLAEEIITLLHSKEDAKIAKKYFVSTFSDQEIPTDIPEVPADKDTKLIDILDKAEMVPSKSQFRRLVEQGAITNLDTDEKIKDDNFTVSETVNIKIGKHRFVKVVI
jgi:tyrosyl-tRNA synthetase